VSKKPNSAPKSDILRRAQAALIAAFGRMVRTPEERRPPEWTLVQGVIGTRTRTPISNAATDRLLERYGSWEKVAAAPIGELGEELRGVSFHNQSARRLKTCLGAIIEERSRVDLRHLSNLPVEDAMAWLEALPGVARKIAAQVMNASSFDRPAMVIDTHHKRIVQRMGLAPAMSNTEQTYDAVMAIVPDEWSAADMDEHHMLLKQLGREVCRPSDPQCENCPLREDCETGKAR
jgi:endonuclease III